MRKNRGRPCGKELATRDLFPYRRLKELPFSDTQKRKATMADGRKDDSRLPRQQDQAEGEREDVEGSGANDNLNVPRQQDQVKGEPKDVEEDVKALKENMKAKGKKITGM